MEPHEIITLMKHYRWLEKEPKTSREQIGSSVRYLMLQSNMKAPDLVDAMEEVDHIISYKYIDKKIQEARWTVDDLDVLQKIFDREPGDITFGYRHLAHQDEENNERLQAD